MDTSIYLSERIAVSRQLARGLTNPPTEGGYDPLRAYFAQFEGIPNSQGVFVGNLSAEVGRVELSAIF